MEPEGRPTLPRVPALDGLRGLAVAGVLLFHGGVTWLGGGFLGVSTFFTLSGFLITSLLIVEHETTGTIALGRFWARRARRLLPALFLTIAGIAVLGVVIAEGAQATRLPGDALSALLYVANWRFVLGDQSYAGLFSEPSFVQHFWSLAIEEQFYLLFPLVVLGVLAGSRHVPGARRARRDRRRLAIVLGAAVAGSAVLAWMLTVPGAEPSRVYYGTDTRAAELLAGALLACAIGGRTFEDGRRARTALAAGGTVALAAILAAWMTTAVDARRLYHGGFATYAALTAIVIAAAHVDGPVQRALAWRPLRLLGFVSYGAYLFHWPVFLWLTPERTGLDGGALLALRLTVTLGLATLSYQFVEQPIRTGARWRTRPALVAAPVALGALAAVVLVAPFGQAAPVITFKPVESTQEVLREARADRRSQPPAPAPAADNAANLLALPDTGGAAAAPAPAPPVQRIMVVGDSVGMTLGRGLERWGRDQGVAVLNSARFWCAIVRGGEVGALLGKRSSPQCESWPIKWAADLDRFQPDVVVVLTTIWDVAGRRRPEWGPDFIGPGDPRFDRWVVSEWRAAAQLLGSRGAQVVWLTTPCAAAPEVDRMLQHANEHYVTALALGGVTTVDLDAHVCPGGTFSETVDGVGDARPDGLHFSDAGADVTARWLGPRLLAART